MNKIYSESIIVGLISLIIGTILFDILKKQYNKKNYKYNDDKITDYFIKISFFFTGIIIHIFIEYFGLNKLYCDKETKKCYKNKNCIFGNCDEKYMNK